MVKVDESCILRYKKEGIQIEALVDFKLLLEYIHDEKSAISIYDIYAHTQLFTDSKKGEIASENIISKLFSNKSEEEILIQLAKEGDPQIPTSYINELRDKKRTQIIEFISSNAINPQTQSKYTPSMISSQFDSLNISIDPHANSVHQAEQALKELRKKMPISMQSSTIIIQVEGQYCGHFYGEFRTFGAIQKEYYDDSGNLHIHISVLSGKIDDVISFITLKSNNTASYHIQKE